MPMKSKQAAQESQDAPHPTDAGARRPGPHSGRQPESHSLAAIVDAMGDGGYVVNEQRQVQYTNSAMCAGFGPVDGRKCYRYIHDRSRPCPKCGMAEVLAGQTVHWEGVSVRTGKTYDCMATPVTNPDGTISHLGVLRDISEKKEMEKALAAE